MDRHTVRYEGPPAFVGLLARCLRDEGVEVDYTPPVERRGLEQMAESVVVSIVSAGALEAIKAGIRKYRERGRPGRIKLDDDEGEGEGNDR